MPSRVTSYCLVIPRISAIYSCTSLFTWWWAIAMALRAKAKLNSRGLERTAAVAHVRVVCARLREIESIFALLWRCSTYPVATSPPSLIGCLPGACDVRRATYTSYLRLTCRWRIHLPFNRYTYLINQ